MFSYFKNKRLRELESTDSPTFAGLTISGLTASSLVATDVNKALTSTTSGISPTFTGVSVGTGEVTAGSINRASGTLTLEIGGTAQLSLSTNLASVPGVGEWYGQYRLGQRSAGNPSFYNTVAGQGIIMEFGTADADATDYVAIQLYGKGHTGTGLSANREGMFIGWHVANSNYEISTDISGTGTARPFVFRIDGTEALRFGTDGALLIPERADALTDVAGYGQLWVKSDTPNVLMFTDDAGTDHTVAFS